MPLTQNASDYDCDIHGAHLPKAELNLSAKTFKCLGVNIWNIAGRNLENQKIVVSVAGVLRYLSVHRYAHVVFHSL